MRDYYEQLGDVKAELAAAIKRAEAAEKRVKELEAEHRCEGCGTRFVIHRIRFCGKCRP